jgi:hypothetical protein
VAWIGPGDGYGDVTDDVCMAKGRRYAEEFSSPGPKSDRFEVEICIEGDRVHVYDV